MNKLFQKIKSNINLEQEFEKKIIEKYSEIYDFFSEENIDFWDKQEIMTSNNFEEYIITKLENHFEERLYNFENKDDFVNILISMCEKIRDISEILKENKIKNTLDEISLEPYLEKITRELEKEIDSCDICNDVMFGQKNWKIEDEFIKGIEVIEFVQDYVSDYDLAKKISLLIRCPKCNCDEFTSIVTCDEMDNFYGINMEYFNKYNIKINFEEIEEFMEVLLNYPMLAIEDKVAKKIKNIIEKNFEKDSEITNHQILYRGRKRSKGKSRYKKDELRIAPYGLTGHGRYNFIGENVLYCSNNVSKLHLELDLSFSEEIDIISLNLKNNTKIFLIEEIFEEFKPLYSIDEIEDKVLKKKYLLTNFISQCVKKVGYAGIEYNCVYDETVKNYAIFKEEFVDYKDKIETYNINLLKEINLII